MAASAGTFVKANAGSGTSLTSGSIGTTTVGDVLCLSTSDGNTGANPTGLDSRTNSGWGQLGTAQVDVTGARMTVLYTQNIASAGAAHTITVSYGSANNISMLAGYITGTPGAGAVDTGSLVQTIDTATPYTVTSGTPAQSDNYILTWYATSDIGSGTDTYVQPSGYALLQQEGNHSFSYTHAVAGKAVNSASGQAVTWASNETTGDRSLKIVAIKSLVASTIGPRAYPQLGGGPLAAGTVGYYLRGNPVAGQYTLTAGGGAFSLTGNAAGFLRAVRLTAAQGSFALSGNAVALKAAVRMPAAAGAFTLNGGAANLLAGKRLVASAGTFALSGQAAGLLAARRLQAAPGAFSLTGGSAGLARALRMPAQAVAFTLTGQVAGLSVARKLTAGAGAYVLTGQAAGLSYGRTLAAGLGTFALTGQAASLLYGRRLSAATGSYAFNGQASGLLYARSMPAGTGAYTISGVAAGLLYGRTLSAGAGSFALSGQNAAFPISRYLTAGTGTYALSGQAVQFSGQAALAAQTGTYALSGQPAGLLYSRIMPAGGGVFDLTGIDVGLHASRVLSAESGDFSLSGQAATFSIASGGGTGASAAAVWNYVLSNGKTAGQNVVEIRSMLDLLAPGFWNLAIEGTYTAADLLRVIAAVQAGKSTITALGGGAATVEFRAADDSETRVTATMAGSERTEVTLNVVD